MFHYPRTVERRLQHWELSHFLGQKFHRKSNFWHCPSLPIICPFYDFQGENEQSGLTPIVKQFVAAWHYFLILCGRVFSCDRLIRFFVMHNAREYCADNQRYLSNTCEKLL